jgi:hypothetical protein
MRFLNRLSLIATLSAASFLLPVTMKAATVIISPQRFHDCGRFNIFCYGHQPYSLTAFENGTVQLPVGSFFGDREFVLVNDTGQPVRMLQFSYFGSLNWYMNMSCGLEDGGYLLFHSCTVAGSGSSGDGTWILKARITPPVEFTYISASWQEGVPPGAYFDIKTFGFSPLIFGGSDRGYLSGTGSGTSTPPSGGDGSGSPGAPEK